MSHPDYKDILKEYLARNKKLRGYRTKLAKAMGCHLSFISQVLKSHVHLTPDQAASAASYFDMTDVEQEIFVCLVNLARCNSVSYKRLMERRIGQNQIKLAQISERIKSTDLDIVPEDRLARYYSSWHVVAIHILCSIPSYDSAKKISQRLGLPEEYVEHVLRELQNGSLIKYNDGRLVCTDKNIHLPSDSPFIVQHHANWRNYVTSRIPAKYQDWIHYSSVVGISPGSAEKIRAMLLSFLSESRTIAVDSDAQDAYYLCADFSPLSGY